MTETLKAYRKAQAALVGHLLTCRRCETAYGVAGMCEKGYGLVVEVDKARDAHLATMFEPVRR
jgi:hypothetical protein